MASVDAKDIPIERQFMTDYWNFRKKFYVPEDNDEYSAEYYEAIQCLKEKYGGSQYM